MTGIFFAHPHTLLDQVGKVLEKSSDFVQETQQ